MRQKEIKKIVFCLVLIWQMLSAPAFSQIIILDPTEKYIGISQGINTSMVLFYPDIKQRLFFPGYTGGISYRYVTEKHWGLQVELKYSQRGWSEADNTYIRRIDYLELPFLTHLYLGDTHRAIINVGPKIGYLLSDRTLKNTSTITNAEQHKSVYFPFDYGATLGLGYNLHTKKSGVYEIEVRGYYALSDIFANKKSDYFQMSNSLNISLNFAWYFQLTGKK